MWATLAICGNGCSLRRARDLWLLIGRCRFRVRDISGAFGAGCLWPCEQLILLRHFDGPDLTGARR